MAVTANTPKVVSASIRLSSSKAASVGGLFHLMTKGFSADSVLVGCSGRSVFIAVKRSPVWNTAAAGEVIASKTAKARGASFYFEPDAWLTVVQ
jgi:hypothetical protein